VTARDRTLLAVIAALAMFGAFWFVAVAPKRAEGQELARRIVAERERLDTAERSVTAGLQAKAGYPDSYATVAKLGKAVPADDELPSLLYQLETAAKGSRIDFQSMSRAGGAASTGAPQASSGAAGDKGAAGPAVPPGAVVGTAGMATVPFSFAFTGSFFDLSRFLGEVQRFVTAEGDTVNVRGRLMSVEGVSFVVGAGSRIEAKIAATAYLQPGGESAPAPAGQAGAAAAGQPGAAPAAPSAPTQTASAPTSGAS
jgi:Tfp pilus assembly protein PilO